MIKTRKTSPIMDSRMKNIKEGDKVYFMRDYPEMYYNYNRGVDRIGSHEIEEGTIIKITHNLVEDLVMSKLYSFPIFTIKTLIRIHDVFPEELELVEVFPTKEALKTDRITKLMDTINYIKKQ